MPSGSASPTTTPTWYRRLPPGLRRVAADSDRLPRLRLDPSPGLRQAVAELPPALVSARPRAVQSVGQRIADGVCCDLAVAKVRIRVAARRPHDQRGELHGLYTPRAPVGPDEITLWMLTAKRGQVVAYRTFLRTLLHELSHHLDYTLFRLRDSLHTQGFYERESSLFGALVPHGDGSLAHPIGE